MLLMQAVTPPVARTLNDVLIAFINQIPAIIAALAALGSLLFGFFNRKTVITAASDAQTAAVKADAAATKADATHTITQAISVKTDQVAAATDGHLSKLTEQVTSLQAENVAFQKTINTLANILTAQRVAQAGAENKDSIVVPSVRPEDLAQAMGSITKMEETHQAEHQQNDKRNQ